MVDSHRGSCRPVLRLGRLGPGVTLGPVLFLFFVSVPIHSSAQSPSLPQPGTAPAVATPASRLQVTIVAPDEVTVAEPVVYQIRVQNNGKKSFGRVDLLANFNPHLEHESRASSRQLTLGDLAEG